MNAMNLHTGKQATFKLSRGNSWIPIIVAIVAAPAITLLMFQFIMMPKVKQVMQEGAHGDAHGHGDSHGGGDHGGGHGGGHGSPSKTFEHIVTNLAGEHRTRFINVSFEVTGSNPHFENVIDANQSAITEATITYFSGLTLAEINNNPRIMYKAKEELRTALNKLEGVAGVVEKLTFTAFNIQ
jgi:flagellar basal body-associated protein FliL